MRIETGKQFQNMRLRAYGSKTSEEIKALQNIKAQQAQQMIDRLNKLAEDAFFSIIEKKFKEDGVQKTLSWMKKKMKVEERKKKVWEREVQEQKRTYSFFPEKHLERQIQIITTFKRLFNEAYKAKQN